MGPNVSDNPSSFRLSVLFMLTGIVAFVLFQLISIFNLAGWIGNAPRNPEGWFHVHLLVLGWATMIAMGAIYQLINVVLQHKIYSIKLGYVQFAFFGTGAVGLIYGFAATRMTWIAVSATLAFIGIVVFAVNMGITLVQAKLWNGVTISAACAVAYLLLAAVMGMLMGLDFAWNFLGAAHERIFGAHIWFAAVGWFGMLITGISYKLFPMFYLSHGFPEKKQYYILWLWNAGVLLGAAAYLFALPGFVKYIAWLLIACALVVYDRHILEMRRKRHKPRPGSGIVFSVYLVHSLTAFAVLMAIFIPLFPHAVFATRTVLFVGWMYLWGWVALTILSYLSKITPFLWWTYKYGKMIGAKNTPTLADLINDRHVRIGLYAIACSLILVLAGIGCGLPIAFQIGGVALSVFSLWYIYLIIRVFTR